MAFEKGGFLPHGICYFNIFETLGQISYAGRVVSESNGEWITAAVNCLVILSGTAFLNWRMARVSKQLRSMGESKFTSSFETTFDALGRKMDARFDAMDRKLDDFLARHGRSIK